MVSKIDGIHLNETTSVAQKDKLNEKEILLFKGLDAYDVPTPKEKAGEDLLIKVLNLLSLEDNFLKASIVEKNGIKYLKLTRTADDKLRSEQRKEFDLGAIKNKLGIEDGVLKKHNDLKTVTARGLNEESSDATIENGQSLLIPLSDLGQSFGFFQFGRKDLNNYVKKYLDTK